MPNYNILVSPMMAVFVASASGGDWQRINTTTCLTGGISISATRQDSYEPVMDNAVQSDYQIVTVNMTGYGDDDLFYKISQGINIGGSINDPPSNEQYRLVLIHPTEGQHSYYFPKVRTQKSLTLNFNKDKATILPVTLIAQNRNTATQLMVKNTSVIVKSLAGIT